jgi:hypothetical protein
VFSSGRFNGFAALVQQFFNMGRMIDIHILLERLYTYVLSYEFKRRFHPTGIEFLYFEINSFAKHRLALQAKSLDALSPLKTLSRGFAAVSKGEKLVSSVNQLTTGDEIGITLSDVSIQARVE